MDAPSYNYYEVEPDPIMALQTSSHGSKWDQIRELNQQERRLELRRQSEPEYVRFLEVTVVLAFVLFLILMYLKLCYKPSDPHTDLLRDSELATKTMDLAHKGRRVNVNAEAIIPKFELRSSGRTDSSLKCSRPACFCPAPGGGGGMKNKWRKAREKEIYAPSQMV